MRGRSRAPDPTNPLYIPRSSLYTHMQIAFPSSCLPSIVGTTIHHHYATQCFSSVVGPNGSGKSNVIDALLFVFGSRAKKIRQDKLKDLIHSSEHHLNMPSCKVAVHFQDIIDRVRPILSSPSLPHWADRPYCSQHAVFFKVAPLFLLTCLHSCLSSSLDDTAYDRFIFCSGLIVRGGESAHGNICLLAFLHPRAPHDA